AAGAELDQRRRAGEAVDLVRVLGEQCGLGARLVVLRLLADALEDLAAGVVVEPSAVEPAGMIRERSHHRLRERVGRLLERIDVELKARVPLASEAGSGVRPHHPPGAMRAARPNQSPCGANAPGRTCRHCGSCVSIETAWSPACART